MTGGKTTTWRGSRGRRSGTALLLAIAATLSGCRGEGTPVRVDYADALYDPAPFSRPRQRFVTCGHLSQISHVIRRPLRLAAEAEGRVELVLGACLRYPGAPGGPPRHQGDAKSVARERPDAEAPQVRLVAKVSRDGAAAQELTFEVGPLWQTQRFDLGTFIGETVEVVLERQGDAEGLVAVRDFALRLERPLPQLRAEVPRALLISLDTFRADAAGALGGSAVTPVLDAFVAEAERFEPHWAAEISTKPSHASLLTGLPVAVHGCDRDTAPLAAGTRTLAERLRDAGVATAGFANQMVLLRPSYGFDRGFDLYRNEGWPTPVELRAAARWLAAQTDRPSFAFVHLYAAHSDMRRWPYESDGGKPAAIARRFGQPAYGCRNGSCGSAMLLAINFGLAPRVPREGELLRALYDAGVETLDADLGTFFADLQRAGLWDDTLIVVTADHGEAFDEHGRLLHSSLHEEVLRVPLLVKWPGGRNAGTTTQRPSTSLDVAPTLLAHFGLTADGLTGQDLAQPPRPRRPDLVSLQAVRQGRWKLHLPTPEDPEVLFDLVADPGETQNLVAEQTQEAARLRQLHAAAESAARERAGSLQPGERLPLAAEDVEQLKALGYIR